MITKLQVELRQRARVLLGIGEPSVKPGNLLNYIDGCYVCPRNKNKSTRKFGSQCRRYACKEHTKDICS